MKPDQDASNFQAVRYGQNLGKSAITMHNQQIIICLKSDKALFMESSFMIKRLLFFAALLLPSLANGGNPTADLSVQIVPSGSGGSCSPSGPATDAANDVAAAGFSTCDMNLDFTSANLPSNWLDCNNGPSNQNDTGFQWFFNIAFRQYNAQPPCSAASQRTDPQTGGLALNFHNTGSLNTDGTSNVAMSTGNWSQTLNQSESNLNVSPRDGHYIEITYWDTWTGGYGILFWSGGPQSNSGAPPNEEFDYLQPGGVPPIGNDQNTDTAIVDWPNGGFCGCDPSIASNFQQLHTYGILMTNDGSTNFSICAYLDGSRYGCKEHPYTGGGGATEAQERRNIYLEYPIALNASSGDVWIHSIKIISCSQWQNPSSSCAGNAFNGNFYTGAGG